MESEGAQLYRELLATYNRLLDLIGPGGTGVRRAMPDVMHEAGAQAATKQIVYVHGIGSHSTGYSDAWWRSLMPYAPSLQPGARATRVEPPDGNRHEVNWSNLVNRAFEAMTDAGEQLEAASLADEIREELEDRYDRLAVAARVENPSVPDLGSTEAVEATLEGMPGFEGINDFVIYMTNEATREEVLARFLLPVRSLLRRGYRLEIIAHSWGTVVAYEGLRRLEADATLSTGTVRHLFTVGSALSIGTVRRNLFGRVGDGRKPRLVDRWINLDARGDIVGGPLARRFGDVEDFVELPAVGCGWFINPACAHGSYWNQDNAAVNRDIFGAFIEE